MDESSVPAALPISGGRRRRQAPLQKSSLEYGRRGEREDEENGASLDSSLEEELAAQ